MKLRHVAICALSLFSISSCSNIWVTIKPELVMLRLIDTGSGHTVSISPEFEPQTTEYTAIAGSGIVSVSTKAVANMPFFGINTFDNILLVENPTIIKSYVQGIGIEKVYTIRVYK